MSCGLVLPRLVGVPARAGIVGGEQMRARVALAMLDAGVARPSLWQRDSTAESFIPAAFTDWLTRHGVAEIDRRFEFDCALSTSAGEWSDDADPADRGHRLILSLTATSAGFARWGQALRWLERAHPQLPATVWQAFHGEVHGRFSGYDYHDAEDYEEMMRDQMDEEDLAMYQKENGSKSWPSGCIPECLSQKPLSAHAIGALKSRWSPAVRATVEGAQRLRVAGKRLHALQLPWKEIDRLVPELSDLGQPPPCFLSIFEEHDPVQAAFDDESQHRWNEEFAPNVVEPIVAPTSDAVREAFMRFGARLTVLREAVGLLDAIPAFHEKWVWTKRGKTLAEVFMDMDDPQRRAPVGYHHTLWEEAA